MISEVRMTRLAQSQLSQYIGYIRRQFRNPQAAKAVAQDARETKAALLQSAESLLCPNLRHPSAAFCSCQFIRTVLYWLLKGR